MLQDKEKITLWKNNHIVIEVLFFKDIQLKESSINQIRTFKQKLSGKK